jgi:hypothetical protein
MLVEESVLQFMVKTKPDPVSGSLNGSWSHQIELEQSMPRSYTLSRAVILISASIHLEREMFGKKYINILKFLGSAKWKHTFLLFFSKNPVR